MPLIAHEYVLYVTFVASKIVFRHRNSMPRKTCKFRLSRNSTKFDAVAIFCETIPTVKSVSSSEIQRINSDFFTEIMILPFLRKLDFLGSYNLPSLKGILSRNSGQSYSLTCICNVHSTMHVNSHLNIKRLNHVPLSLNKKR